MKIIRTVHNGRHVAMRAIRDESGPPDQLVCIYQVLAQWLLMDKDATLTY